ncbi:YrbL family protein [Vreelandella massiliensis]|uniref:YrbL family protein n=1 Tax=Vreelandella massiliensis TaxID=1816686 RepID=UPI00096A9B80|nr:YrbL family protein [Halomonas massiliensis]
MNHVILHKDLLIGEGNKRFCFQHPDDKEKCIKVKKTKHGLQENFIDWFYYGSLNLKKKEVPCLVRCHGLVCTNLGYGVVFDRVLDENGVASYVLNEFLTQKKEVITYEGLLAMVKDLEMICLEKSIAVVEPNEKNIMVKKQFSGFSFVLVDGVGGRGKLSLKVFMYVIFPWYARKKTKKQFDIFKDKIKYLNKKIY